MLRVKTFKRRRLTNFQKNYHSVEFLLFLRQKDIGIGVVARLSSWVLIVSLSWDQTCGYWSCYKIVDLVPEFVLLCWDQICGYWSRSEIVVLDVESIFLLQR